MQAPPPSSDAPPPATEARCLACTLPLSRCPASHTSCVVCGAVLGTGSASPDDQPDGPRPPVEMHQPHNRSAVRDAWGYVLTWGTVLSSHAALVQHASCDANRRLSGFDSDRLATTMFARASTIRSSLGTWQTTA